MTRIKICGLKREEDIAYVNEARPDFAGFIINVPESSRNVDVSLLYQLTALLDPAIAPVGVFVDEDEKLVAGLLKERVIRAAQLHGHEDPGYISRLRALTQGCGEIWKAFKIRNLNDIKEAVMCSADRILLDGGAGDGRVFDWSLLRKVNRPYILAGGLNEENISRAIGTLHPWGVDMSSGAETMGIKDPGKILNITALVRQENLSE